MPNDKRKNLNGLTAAEVAKRLKKYGKNVVTEKKKITPVLIFLNKLKSPLLILLMVISVLSFAVGERTSALIVIFTIVLSAALDFFNTYKSQKAVAKLEAAISTKVTVIRGGKKHQINSKNVVPGDIVFLAAGNIVPADGEVTESDDFFVNQSALTGESVPVEKTTGETAIEAEITPENEQAVFMGTSVVSGFATIRVISTGRNTRFGRIAKDLCRAEPKTDFETSLKNFSVFIMKVIFVMVSVVFIIYLLRNVGHLNKGLIIETFAFALAITIGVTPELLPVIVTICLSRGSQRMAKKEVIVKHLSSIENFGSMDILCTDKTGTLTQDRIALVKCLDYTGQDSDKVWHYGYLSSYYHTGVKNPLDEAIRDHKKAAIEEYEKIDEIPYDFTRKRSSMVVRKGRKRYLITKGAPEEILKIAKRCETGGRIEIISGLAAAIEEQFQGLSEEGFRVLALAYKEVPEDRRKVYGKEEEKDLIFLGFLAFLDPPKDGVKQTILELNNLGIEVKILTGDNDRLAGKICREIGLEFTEVVKGEAVKKMSDGELLKKALTVNVFARITPDQKERIISVLRQSGKSVGYLGDGINDAPALKAADVGISVNNAVDIAKDTADIILMRKSLESLLDGVIEGRKTFHNTMKYILMGLSSNFGNMFSMMGASAFLPFLPMRPAQILFNNFLYDLSQVSLPSDEVDREDLLKPAHWDLKFIKTYMIVFGWISSLFDFLTFYLLYYVYRLSEGQFQAGWFIESIATQIFVIYIIRTKKTPLFKSRPSRALFITTFLAVAFAWALPFTPLGELLSFARPPLSVVFIIAGYVAAYLILVEIVKRLFYYYHNKAIKNKAGTQ